MSQARKLAADSSYYFGSNLLVTFAGAISLPLWTRLLDLEQYGLLSLVSVSVSFLVIFSKFGLQHASLRFYSEVRAGQTPHDLKTYYSTMVIAGVGVSVGVTALIAAGVGWVVRDNPRLSALLIPVAAVIVVQSATNSLAIFLRAERRAILFSVINVARRYGRLGMALLMVLLLGAHVRNITLGWILAGGLIFLFLLLRQIRLGQLSLRRFSPDLLRQAVAYGFPMIWAEVANVTLSVGDRYVLQYYMGEEAVGVYSVGYNLSTLGQSLLGVPLRLAVIPTYLALWADKGAAQTRSFVNLALRYYFMLGVPLMLGVVWYKREIVALLATEKFIEAHTIVPLIIIPLVVRGAYGIYGAGLYIRKKTVVFMYCTLAAAAANLALNILLVPLYGLMGAAASTLVAYLLMTVVVYGFSYRYMKVSFAPLSLLSFGLLSLGAMLLADLLVPADLVLVKIGVVIVVYGALVFALDRDARMLVRSVSSGPGNDTGSPDDGTDA